MAPKHNASKRTRFCPLAFCLAAILLFTFMPAKAAGAPAVSAESAILMDFETGRVLYEKNADARMLIASTTKIMTALVVLERCKPGEKVAIVPEYTGIEGSSAYLTAGETLTVKELLYCMLLKSGNDAAVALACHTAGSIGAFAALMNLKAAELGCENSSFKNPHGLDADGQFSSARDLAVITRAAMENALFRTIVATESCTIGQRYLTNHNKLLKFYDGCTGVKTGYTEAAGRSLVSSAQRNGQTLIAVTINAPDDWADHQALLDYGFTYYHTVTLCTAGDTLAALPVIGGVKDSVGAYAAQTITLTASEDETVETKLFLPAFCYASVGKNTHAGCLRVYLNGEVAAETELLYTGSVARTEPKRGLFGRLWESIF